MVDPLIAGFRQQQDCFLAARAVFRQALRKPKSRMETTSPNHSFEPRCAVLP